MASDEKVEARHAATAVKASSEELPAERVTEAIRRPMGALYETRRSFREMNIPLIRSDQLR